MVRRLLKLADIIESVQVYDATADVDLVKKAYVFASTSHEGQKRKSGEPYITHPLAVAHLITVMKLDTSSICAALLHDTVEDTQATLEDVDILFGKEIAALVDGVTKLGKLRFRNKQERQAESFRKMLVAMSKDIRVILVKLADRLHNMRTLGNLDAAKAAGIARETMDIFAPLANRLGIQWMKTELEDLSFRYLQPEAYQEIRGKVAEKRSEREAYIEEVKLLLEAAMVESTIEGDVYGRPKHFYSIFRKMRAQNIEYEQVYDAIAFRILTDDVGACYNALGVIHTKWRPIPGRFKDYIALPKPNRYQSLHTAVLGPRNQRMEVQIRTHDMHRIAEFGIAAHWKYKEGDNVGADDEQKFAWLRQLLEWQRELDDPTDFFDMVKLDLFNAEVYVFTPNGDLKVLAKGSTPVDFAYAIHSEVGAKAAGALVNHAMVPLDYQLRSGDTCEIMTRNDGKPNVDWLRFVRTARARSRIRAYVRIQERERSYTIGKEVLDKGLRRYRKSFNKELRSGRMEALAQSQYKLKTARDLCVLVGYGKITSESVVNNLVPEAQREKLKDKKESTISKMVRGLVGNRGGIVVDGIDDVVVRFARCCDPVRGDAVTGFITRGRGVAIHTMNCRHVRDGDPDRRIDVRWDEKGRSHHAILLRIVSANTPGLLASISGSFQDFGINITEANCKTDSATAMNTFQVIVESAEQLRTVMRSIERIKGVHSVERVQN
ncbi:MAG: guanosine-3',5'-bis(diphosphate) 3'-pyrophosphohydrolase [Myxococcota bacterium]|jgi:guanosine-3',5'-bis(diphosphate) 3'-pyrophosphohydrolase